MKKITYRILAISTSVILSACGGGGTSTSTSPAPIKMSGAVSGLKSGSVVIDINGANPITFSANGSYSDQIVNTNTNSYVLRVVSQPVNQTCTISSGYLTGVVDSLENVQIICATETLPVNVLVSGKVGFSGSTLVLSNNTSDQISITENGQYTFDLQIPYNSSYSVTVTDQPTGQTCTVVNGAGPEIVAAASNISVICAINTYKVSGVVSGLTGGQVTLIDNGTDSLTVGANGSFTFAVPVTYEGTFAVSIGQQPVGQTCVVTNNNPGPYVFNDISNIGVLCSP